MSPKQLAELALEAYDIRDAARDPETDRHLLDVRAAVYGLLARNDLVLSENWIMILESLVRFVPRFELQKLVESVDEESTDKPVPVAKRAETTLDSKVESVLDSLPVHHWLDITVHVVVDKDGDFEVGTTSEESHERYQENYGSSGPFRYLEIDLQVPRPQPAKVSVVVAPDNGNNLIQVR